VPPYTPQNQGYPQSSTAYYPQQSAYVPPQPASGRGMLQQSAYYPTAQNEGPSLSDLSHSPSVGPPSKKKPLPPVPGKPLSETTRPPRPAEPLPSTQNLKQSGRTAIKSPTGKKITVVSGKDLRAADLNGKSDPYCKISFSSLTNVQFKTPVIQKTLEPVWNYNIPYPIPINVEKVTLKIEVWDEDVTNDDFLGNVDIQNLDVSKNGSYTYTVIYKNKNSGSLIIKVSDV